MPFPQAVSRQAAPSDHPAPSPRFVGIDGLRAIALLAVLLFHLAPSVVPGGYAGVDVFFVISGFLITGLLLRERRETGTIALRGFAARRARRLVPAAVLVVAVTTACAVLVGGDVLVGVPQQLAGIATLSSNWQLLFSGSGYFAQARTGLFDNFWSLAIEEQFYLVWPLLLLLVTRGDRVIRLRWLGSAAVVAALVPLGLTAADHVGAAYLATPAHSFGLLVGAVIAVAVERAPDADSRAADTGRPLWTAALGAALVAFAVLIVLPLGASAACRSAVTVLGAGLGGAMVLGAVRGAPGIVGRIDRGPLGWLGRRSYGVYLWHLPLIVLASATLPDTAGLGVLPGHSLALVIAVLAAAGSYRWVEGPVLRSGFHLLLTCRPARAAAAALAVGLLVASGAAVAAAPDEPAEQRAVEQGGGSSDADGSVPPLIAPATPDPTPTADGPAPTTPVPSPTPDTATRPGMPPSMDGSSMVAIGDSVMLASKNALEKSFPGITVDAAVNRQLTAAPDLVRSHVSSHPGTSVIVLALGTNGDGGSPELQEAIAAAGDRRVVLVDVSAPVSWESSVDGDITEAASENGNVRIAHWKEQASAHPELLAKDRIHPGSLGADLYAKTVRAAVDAFD